MGGFIVEKIMGAIRLVLPRFVGDKDKRNELEAELRTAVVVAASVWGPLGVSTVLSVAGMVAYFLVVAWLDRPLIYEIALILMLIPSAAFGIDLRQWLKLRKEWREQREDERR